MENINPNKVEALEKAKTQKSFSDNDALLGRPQH